MVPLKAESNDKVTVQVPPASVTGVEPKATNSSVDVSISTKIVVPGSAPLPLIDCGKVFVVDGIPVMVGVAGAVPPNTSMRPF